MQKKLRRKVNPALLCCLLFLCWVFSPFTSGSTYMAAAFSSSDILSEIPEYSGSAYVVINDNVPEFDEEDFTTDSFETYSELDSLGRCQTAFANIGIDLMPVEERGDISSIYPTGWVQNEYEDINGGYLYNRCHLIAYELTAENANEENLITGTRYFNIEGMLPFENMVADYIKETENHVLYRVTPVFEEDNLLAAGVQIEAESVEDEGEGILFNVFCYNVQPEIVIDYATGENKSADSEESISDNTSDSTLENTSENKEDAKYILNTNSLKFHYPDCRYVEAMSEKNREEYTGDRAYLIEKGYSPCKWCNP